MSSLPPNVTDAMIEQHFGDPECNCGHCYSDHDEKDNHCLGCGCKNFEGKSADEPDVQFEKRHEKPEKNGGVPN